MWYDVTGTNPTIVKGIVSPVVATGSILGDSVSRLEDVVVA